MKEYICPLCKATLTVQYGNNFHPNDPVYGVTLKCLNIECPAQEVFGYGKNEKEAFEVITAKYKH